MKKARGSAIIIAMLLISAVGGLAFSFARLVFLEMANASLYENGSVAYYAAESGIEEAFLRYRYNRNDTVPSSEALSETRVIRSDLTGGTAIGTAISKTSNSYDSLPLRRTSQYFDLNMQYLGTDSFPIYGHEVNGSNRFAISNDIRDPGYESGEYSYLRIGKDNSIKIDLSGYDFLNNDIVLYSKHFMTVPISGCKATAEIKFTVVKSDGTTKEYKDMLSYNPTICSSVLQVDRNKLYQSALAYQDGANNIVYLDTSLRNIIARSGAGYPLTSDSVSLSIKPYYYDMAIGLVGSKCVNSYNQCSTKADTVPGAYTRIDSYGYYAGISRKISANIDRQSGSLYDLYDYVIYKQN